MVQWRGNTNTSIMDMLRQNTTRLDVVETNQRRGEHLDDVSDDEAIARLKGHASLWWKHLQTDRQRRGKRRSRLGLK